MREESSTLLTVLRSAASIAVPDVAHADVFVLLFVVVVAVAIVAVAIVAVVDVAVVAALVVDVVVDCLNLLSYQLALDLLVLVLE